MILWSEDGAISMHVKQVDKNCTMMEVSNCMIGEEMDVDVSRLLWLGFFLSVRGRVIEVVGV